MSERSILQLKCKDNTVRKKHEPFAKPNHQTINPRWLAEFCARVEAGETATKEDIKTLVGEIFRLRGRFTVMRSNFLMERQHATELEARLARKRP